MPNGARRVWRTSSDSNFSRMAGSEMSQTPQAVDVEHAVRSAMLSESDATGQTTSVVNPYVAGVLVRIDPSFEKRTM